MVMNAIHTGVTGRAMDAGIISVEAVDIRDFTYDRHHKVDDYTFGGGAGLLMKAQPVWECCEAVQGKLEKRARVVYLTPTGEVFSQQKAEEFSHEEDLILLCGHYEGVDDRVLQEVVTDYISIGDYVLTGGELPAMIVTDAVARLVPGVLHNDESAETDSFQNGLLEYPQYTRPAVWRDREVPEILISGNHEAVAAWRLEQSLALTKERRPDLYEAWMAAHPPKPEKKRRKKHKKNPETVTTPGDETEGIAETDIDADPDEPQTGAETGKTQ